MTEGSVNWDKENIDTVEYEEKMKLQEKEECSDLEEKGRDSDVQIDSQSEKKNNPPPIDRRPKITRPVQKPSILPDIVLERSHTPPMVKSKPAKPRKPILTQVQSTPPPLPDRDPVDQTSIQESKHISNSVQLTEEYDSLTLSKNETPRQLSPVKPRPKPAISSEIIKAIQEKTNAQERIELKEKDNVLPEPPKLPDRPKVSPLEEYRTVPAVQPKPTIPERPKTGINESVKINSVNPHDDSKWISFENQSNEKLKSTSASSSNLSSFYEGLASKTKSKDETLEKPTTIDADLPKRIQELMIRRKSGEDVSKSTPRYTSQPSSRYTQPPKVIHREPSTPTRQNITTAQYLQKSAPKATPAIPSVRQSAFRIWTDASGTFKVEARFVRLEDKTIHLQKKNGVFVAVPAELLSTADVEHVKRITINDLKQLQGSQTQQTRKVQNRPEAQLPRSTPNYNQRPAMSQNNANTYQTQPTSTPKQNNPLNDFHSYSQQQPNSFHAQNQQQMYNPNSYHQYSQKIPNQFSSNTNYTSDFSQSSNLQQYHNQGYPPSQNANYLQYDPRTNYAPQVHQYQLPGSQFSHPNNQWKAPVKPAGIRYDGGVLQPNVPQANIPQTDEDRYKALRDLDPYAPSVFKKK